MLWKGKCLVMAMGRGSLVLRFPMVEGIVEYQWSFPEVSPILNLTVKPTVGIRSGLNLLSADETYRRGESTQPVILRVSRWRGGYFPRTLVSEDRGEASRYGSAPARLSL